MLEVRSKVPAVKHSLAAAKSRLDTTKYRNGGRLDVYE
jgi:hypothetical protein